MELADFIAGGKFLNFEIISKILSIWFVLLVIFFGAVTVILNFHWKQYGVTAVSLKKLKIVYFTVSFLILGIMAALITTYQSL